MIFRESYNEIELNQHLIPTKFLLVPTQTTNLGLNNLISQLYKFLFFYHLNLTESEI